MRRNRRYLLALVALAAMVAPMAPAVAARLPLINTVPDDHCGSNGMKPALVLQTRPFGKTGGLDPFADSGAGWYEKWCLADNTAKANGSPQRLPGDPNVVEPGQELRVIDTRTYSRADKDIRVTFTGTGLVFDKTFKAKQGCGNTGVCTGWKTDWTAAQILPDTVGYFIVSTSGDKGVTKACFQTLRSFCPEKL